MSDGFYLVEDGRIVGEIPSESVAVEETPDGVRFIVHGPLGACTHPVALRRPIPGYESDDPAEWECGACGTWQARGRQAHDHDWVEVTEPGDTWRRHWCPCGATREGEPL